MRLRTFTTVRELLWYNCSPVCGLPTRWFCSGTNDELLKNDLCQHTELVRTGVAKAPVPVAGHCWPLSLQETLKHSQVGLAQCLVGVTAPFSGGPWYHQVLFVFYKLLCRIWGLILNVIVPFLPFCCSFFTCGHGVSFLDRFQHSPVDGCSADSCDFGFLTGEDEHTSFNPPFWQSTTRLL